MENRDTIIKHLRGMAAAGQKPSQVMRYLVLDLGMTDQVEMMKLFSEALNVSMGEVTPIVGWWHEGEYELNDNDLDAYLMHLIDNYQPA